jgi:hypothetical protein
MEAVDCFCCMIPKRDIRERLIRVIAGGIFSQCLSVVAKLFVKFGTCGRNERTII